MGTDFKTRAHQLLELAHKAGLEAAEVYQMQTKTQLACFDANHLKQIENREAIGLALRIWNQGKPGLAVAKGNVALPQVLEQAIGLSELSPPQEIQLPKHQLCTPDLNRGTPVPREQLVDWGKSAIADILEQQELCSCSAEISCESEDVYLINSEGLECGYIDTTLRSFLTTEWIRGHDFLCIEANQTQRDQIQIQPLIQRIQQSLQWSEKQIAPPKGVVPILFTPNASEVLWDTIQAALNGQKVLEEISPWAYQKNEAVLSSQLNLSQQPTIGPYSCPFDDEGYPSQDIHLVIDGKLNQFFTDHKTSNFLGSKSTGNGFRPHLHNYPVPELINLIVAPGTETFEELVEITRTSPRRQVPMVKDGLEFTQLGEFELSKLTNNILFEENVFLLLL